MKRSKPVQAHYLTANDVRQIFGGISSMSLHRWLNDENKNFPRPVYIGNRRFFKVEEIENFKKLLDAGGAGGPRTVRKPD